jgi:hypothetical protein
MTERAFPDFLGDHPFLYRTTESKIIGFIDFFEGKERKEGSAGCKMNRAEGKARLSQARK